MGIFQIVALVLSLNNSAWAFGPGKRGPPPEAKAACEGKAAGDACSFTKFERTFKGLCGQPKPELPLTCRPERAKK